jgi:NAD(P)-dependent dehydrogenase (short-subunit alcohol dehydrogenase family)
MTSIDSTPIPDYPAMLRLDGKGLIVVGAGQGIGRQTAAALSQAGAHVLCCDIRSDLAHEIAAEIGETPWVGDATKRDEVERLVTEASSSLGRIDGFVDIIGMAHYSDAVAVDDERWNWQFDIVLRHAFLLSQNVGRAMQATGRGTMVFVCSSAAYTAAPQTAPYGAAKAALISWIKTIADEFGPSGIRANGVAPGMVYTPRVSGLIGEEGRALVAGLTPLQRMGVPSDIAAAALFFSSDLSSFVTGQTLLIDGGITNRFPYPMAELAKMSGVSSPAVAPTGGSN